MTAMRTRAEIRDDTERTDDEAPTLVELLLEATLDIRDLLADEAGQGEVEDISGRLESFRVNASRLVEVPTTPTGALDLSGLTLEIERVLTRSNLIPEAGDPLVTSLLLTFRMWLEAPR